MGETLGLSEGPRLADRLKGEQNPVEAARGPSTSLGSALSASAVSTGAAWTEQDVAFLSQTPGFISSRHQVQLAGPGA